MHMAKRKAIFVAIVIVFRSSKTTKNAFKDKVKEIQAEMDQSSSETPESGFASPAEERPSPR